MTVERQPPRLDRRLAIEPQTAFRDGWSTAEIKLRHEEAAVTLQRLPDPDRRFRGHLRAHWPATVQSSEAGDFARDVQRVKDAMAAETPRLRFVVSDSAAIDRMYVCFTWLAAIPDRKRRFIVWAKAVGISTYRVRRALGCAYHRNTIRYHANQGLKEIARSLNGERVKGEGLADPGIHR